MSSKKYDVSRFLKSDIDPTKNYRPIINPETGLEKSMIRITPDSKDVVVNLPEIYCQGDDLRVFPATALTTSEGLVNPIRKSIQFSTLSDAEKENALQGDILRRQAEQMHFVNELTLRDKKQPVLADVISLGIPLKDNNNIELPIQNDTPTFAFINGSLVLEDLNSSKSEMLTNFDLKPIKENIYLFDEDITERTVTVKIIFTDHETIFDISSDNIKDILDYARKADIQCNVDFSPSKTKEKVSNYFVGQLKGISKIYIQKQRGWTTFKGKNIYSHDSHPAIHLGELEFKTGVKLLRKNLTNNETVEILFSALEIGPVRVMAPILGTSLLAPLFRIFTNGNDEYRPSFLTFINGKSGSLKTAIAKVFFTLFDADNPKVTASFKDTATSMEIRLKEGRSAVTLIDDYYATASSMVKNEMQKNLETVIRYVGDGTGRHRSNPSLHDIKGTRPEGMVCVTGEDTDGQLSTLLRCLIINVDKGTFDGQKLELFQKDKLLWSTFMSAFIDYIENNYEQIQSFINYNFNEIRKTYRNSFTDLRPVDQMVQLHLTYAILEQFLISLIGNSDMITRLCSDCISGCYEAVKLSHEYATENSAENQYPITVHRLITKKELLLADTKEIYKRDMKIYDGFESDDYYIIDSEKLHAKVVAHFKRINREFPLTLASCKLALHRAGLLKTDCENQGTGKEKILYEVKVTLNDGKRVRMLHIIKSAFELYINENL